MLFLLAAVNPALAVVGFFASVATVAGAVKLGLETFEKYDDIRQRMQQSKQQDDQP